MTWKIADQDFNVENVGPGRIIVHLADGHHLSIITAERNDYLREARRYAISAWDFADVVADDGEFEIGLMTEAGDYGGTRMNPEPADWTSHATEADGWIYIHMTADMIERVVEERGLAE